MKENTVEKIYADHWLKVWGEENKKRTELTRKRLKAIKSNAIQTQEPRRR